MANAAEKIMAVGNTTSRTVMGMVSKAHDGKLNMPPGIAERILDDLNFEGQRKPDALKVQSKLHLIKMGLWDGSFPISLAKLPNGTLILIDGQHRLMAICELGSPLPLRVIIDPAKDMVEVRRRYCGFDGKDAVRSTTAILEAADVSKAIGVGSRMRNAAFSAVPFLMNKMEPPQQSSVSVPDKLVEVVKWAAEAQLYEKIISVTKGVHRSKLHNAGTVAVAFYTLRHQPAKAKDFWMGVANNDGLRKGDPRATFITDMFERTLNSGAARQNVQQPSLAWNAYCEGRELKIIKCISGAPVHLWGTPLNGKGGK